MVDYSEEDTDEQSRKRNVLSEQDRAAISFASSMIEDEHDPRLKIGTQAATLAVDRWGRDLVREAGEQQFSAFQDAVEASIDDIIEIHTDEEADVDGIEDPIVEGRILDRDLLRETVEMVVSMIEDESEFDRHTPGPIVEPVIGGSDT